MPRENRSDVLSQKLNDERQAYIFFMLHSTHWGYYILCLKILCALILVLKHELVLVLALTSLYGPPLASKLQWGLKL